MIYRFFPRSYRESVRARLKMAGMKTTNEKFINNAVIISLIIAAVITIIVKIQPLFVFTGSFGAAFFFMNAYITLVIDKRKLFVETVLPDALELMAANIRAGFIPSKALLLSARDEFGPLAEAIRNSGKEIMTGKSLTEGMMEIPKYIKSEILERAIILISEGATSGGQLVSLLEENAIDIRRRQAMEKEVKANIIMYGIFIVFAGVLGAPVLYALSLYLISTLTALGGSEISSADVMSSGVPFFKGGVEISPDFLFIFSIVSIIVTTFFSGIIIGLIDSGKEKGGIKYIPIFMIIGISVFLIANFVIGSMFSAFMP
ncbi:MAG: type II secretion system F family protein [Candidatus Aenigmarchaeota archaeon]|nr:type II secretion system F family protein [Candidatus Aenigmarchaeota archaeon]